jgi:hypothetical protein
MLMVLVNPYQVEKNLIHGYQFPFIPFNDLLYVPAIMLIF